MSTSRAWSPEFLNRFGHEDTGSIRRPRIVAWLPWSSGCPPYFPGRRLQRHLNSLMSWDIWRSVRKIKVSCSWYSSSSMLDRSRWIVKMRREGIQGGAVSLRGKWLMIVMKATISQRYKSGRLWYYAMLGRRPWLNHPIRDNSTITPLGPTHLLSHWYKDIDTTLTQYGRCISHLCGSKRTCLQKMYPGFHHNKLSTSRKHDLISPKTYQAVLRSGQSIFVLTSQWVHTQTDTKHFQLPETPHLPKQALSPNPRS
jgi:hypothetical protein